MNQDRWSYHPVLNEKGNVLTVDRLNDNDLAILKALNTYRALDPQLVGLLVGRPTVSVRMRLKVLAAEPNRYLNYYNIDKQKRYLKITGYQWYSLADAGKQALRDHGIEPYEHGLGSEFLHETGVQAGIACLSYGAEKAGVEIRFSKDILAHPNFPASTKKEDSPFSIKTVAQKAGYQPVEFKYRSDGFLWHKTDKSIFLNVEFEHKNRATSGSFEQTSFLKKYCGLDYIRKHRLTESRWGIPYEQIYTLVWGINQHHVESMKGVIESDRQIMFKVFPALSTANSIVPQPDMYETPWQRAGHPDVTLKEV